MERDRTRCRARKRALVICIVLLLAATVAILLWSGRADGRAAAAPVAKTLLPASSGSSSDAASGVSPLPPAPTQSVAARVLKLRSDAAAGDPVAMRELSGLIQRCGFGTSHGALFWKGIESVALQLNAAEVGMLRAVAARREAQCENLPGTRKELALQHRQLMNSAAEKGDLLARLQQRSRASDPERIAALPDDAAELVDDALMSGDPRVLYEMAFLYTLSPRAPMHAGIGSSPLDNTALILLACERGLDCGVGSDHADDMCLMGMMCTRSFDYMVWKQAEADGEMKAVEGRMQWLRMMLDEADRAR